MLLGSCTGFRPRPTPIAASTSVQRCIADSSLLSRGPALRSATCYTLGSGCAPRNWQRSAFVCGSAFRSSPITSIVSSSITSVPRGPSNSRSMTAGATTHAVETAVASSKPPAAGEGAGGSKHAQQQQALAASHDIIPLVFSRGTVSGQGCEGVLESMHTGMYCNGDVSEQGGLVLGLSSPVGSTAMLDIRVGKLGARRMLACARSKLWWMTPEWRTSTKNLPPETQFLLTEVKEGGPYAILLPLIDGDYRATLRPANVPGTSDGDLVLRVESGDDRVQADAWDALLYVAASWDPYELIERGVTMAAKLSGGAKPRSSKQLPASLDAFGWCTWDAFYSTVSARGLQEGLRSLHDGGITPRLLIIDDGWQMTDVDPPYRKPPTTPAELAEKLHLLPPEEQQLLRNTEGDFYHESMEVLAETAEKLAPGTSAGNVMPALANLGSELGSKAQPHGAASPSSSISGAAGGSASGASSRRVTDSGAASAAKAQQQQVLVVEPEVQPVPPPEQQRADSTQAGSPEVQTPQKEDAIWIVRAGQKIAGWLVGLATAAFLIFYQWVIEPAPPFSIQVKLFAAAAQGILRPALIGFFCAASDFTRRLTSVKANGKFSSPDAGPDEPWGGKEERMNEVVAHIKKKYGVHYIYCWHGLPAYWAGVMPDAPDVAEYGASIMYAKPTPGVLEIEPSMGWSPAVLAGVGVLTDPAPVYNAMHAYLSGSGIDGVKVDCQAGVSLVGNSLGGGPALSRRFHAALEASVAAHFPGNHAINCMCHSTENLYRMTSTAVARASDDFYPRDPASSHPHIAACAYNSVFMGVLIQPDWDMFHSKHPAARLHALARAVSGGAVYVSDKPGDHDLALLRTLVLKDGTILRAMQPGRPTRDCLFMDPLRDGKTLLKVWNVNPVVGVVGVFHLQGASWDRTRRKFYVHDRAPAPLTTQVRPLDVEPFRRHPASQQYAVYSFTAGRMAVVPRDGVVDVSLRSAEGDVVSVAPVIKEGDLSFAALGLCDMMNGGGAVRSVNIRTDAAAGSSSNGNGAAGRPVVDVSVRGSGTFLCYSSQKPARVQIDGLGLFFSWDEASGRLQVDVPPTESLNCDLRVTY